jgi:AhpC/TSA family
MTTIIAGDAIHEVAAAPSAKDLWLAPAQFEAITGFTLKPEGFCRDALCIPIPPKRDAEFHRGGTINIAKFADLTRRPWVGTDGGDVWVLEEPAETRNEALQSLEAPDFELPDVDGNLHRLSDYRGRKVLLASWASW